MKVNEKFAPWQRDPNKKVIIYKNKPEGVFWFKPDSSLEDASWEDIERISEEKESSDSVNFDKNLAMGEEQKEKRVDIFRGLE